MKKSGKRDPVLRMASMCYVSSKGIVPICGCRKSYQVKELAEAEKEHVVDVLMQWIGRQMKG